MILLPQFTRQPESFAWADRTSPLVQGLVELVIPYHMRSSITGMQQITGGGSGTRTWRAGQHGIYRWCDRTAVYEDRYRSLRGVTGDITFFMLGGTDGALGATQRLVLLQTTGGTRRAAMGEEGTSKWAFNTNPSGGSAVDAIEASTTLGEDHFYVGRLSGTTQEIFVDGVSVGSNTQTGNNFSDIGQLSLNTTGFLSGGSGRIYLVGWAARAWTDEEIYVASRNPWAMFEPRKLVISAGASGSTGTIAATLGSDTSAFTGTTTVIGTIGVTLGSDTSAFTGTTTVIGTIGATLGNDTSAFTGTVGGAVDGTIAVTLSNDTSAFAGTTTVIGTIASTLGSDTSAFAGTTTIIGTIASTLGSDTSAFTGTPILVGSIGITLGSDTSAFSGAVGSIPILSSPLAINITNTTVDPRVTITV